MIFQCTNCRARFRVADEKVAERGVKVRCTKCTVVFKVTREDAIESGGRPATEVTGPAPQPRALHAPVQPPRAPHTQPSSDDFGIDLGLNLDLAPPPSSRPLAGTPNRTPEQTARRLPAMPPMSAGRQASSGPPTPADPFAALDLGLLPEAARTPPQAPKPPANEPRGEGSFESNDPFALFTDPFAQQAESPPPAIGPDAFELDPFADASSRLEDDPFAGPTPTTPAFVRPQARPTPDPFADFASQDNDSSTQADPFDDDFAASLRQAPDGRSGGQVFDFGEVTDGAHLDLATAGSSSGNMAQFKKLALAERVGVPSAPSLASSRRTFGRELASSLFNVTSAFVVGFAALVAIASLRSPRALTADDLGFDLVWIAMGYTQPLAEQEQLRAFNVRTGVYRTRSGEELFYVRGDVENASSASRSALQVVVEVSSKNELLGRAESLSRLDAGPEALFELEDRDNNTLQKRLVLNAQSLAVAAHARAPFIAIFPLNAKQVDGAQVKVSVTDRVPAALRDSVGQKPADDNDIDVAAATGSP